MSEAANVTGPDGKAVQGSSKSVDKNSNYKQKFQRIILNANYSSNLQRQNRKAIKTYKQAFAITEKQEKLAKKNTRS